MQSTCSILNALPTELHSQILSYSDITTFDQFSQTESGLRIIACSNEAILNDLLLQQLDLDIAFRTLENLSRAKDIYTILIALRERTIIHMTKSQFGSLSPAYKKLISFYIQPLVADCVVLDFKIASLKTIRKILDTGMLDKQLIALCQEPLMAAKVMNTPYLKSRLPLADVLEESVPVFIKAKNRKQTLASIEQRYLKDSLSHFIRVTSNKLDRYCYNQRPDPMSPLNFYIFLLFIGYASALAVLHLQNGYEMNVTKPFKTWMSNVKLFFGVIEKVPSIKNIAEKYVSAQDVIESSQDTDRINWSDDPREPLLGINSDSEDEEQVMPLSASFYRVS